MSKKHFFAGTFLLSTVGVISRIMGFFYRIFLSQTIGSRGIGLYQLVVPLQHMVLAVTTSGIQTALSRTVASQTALKKKKEAVDSFCVGTLFALGLSLAAMWIFYTFAGWFAGEILKEPETEAGSWHAVFHLPPCMPASAAIISGEKAPVIRHVPNSSSRLCASSLPIYL